MSIDLEGLRSALFVDTDARVAEKVEVNQRHLIDKILARYSAEHTIYREVLQNANDACATSMEIRFEGAVPELGNKHSDNIVTSLTMRNNGNPFSSDDWRRLKKIAEGNPDEQKIGFFGVGFYSLFSICDEPFVVSGDSCLAFYWQGDQLYARPGLMPDHLKSDWTSIFLKLREPISLPDLDIFAHFISKSILFTDSMEIVNVLHNDETMFRIMKKRSAPSKLSISPLGLLTSLSTRSSGLFTLKNVLLQAVQLDLDKRYTSEVTKEKSGLLSNIWTIAKNITKDRQTKVDEEKARMPGIFSLFLHLIICDVKVMVNQSFAAAMERITKKRPPSSLKLFLLYSSFDESLASTLAFSSVPHPVLNGVLPDSANGRIFIGFETHQSTGLAVHIAASFIPTVERESLDFVDRSLASWNEELIRMAGKVVRLVYEIEMQKLRKLYPTDELKTDTNYWDRAHHIYQVFGITQSVPSPIVSVVLEEELFNSTKKSFFLVPSSLGVVSVDQLRTIPSVAASFTKNIPTLNPNSKLDRFIDSIHRYFVIPEASGSEVIQSLDKTSLDDSDLIACLNWIASYSRLNKFHSKSLNSMISNILVPVGATNVTDQRLPLARVTHFPIRSLCHDSGLPLPEYCLSPLISNQLSGHDLSQIFALKELNLIGWINFIVKTDYIGNDSARAEKLLIFIGKHCSRSTEIESATIASSLSGIEIIPTQKGLRKPKEAFLENTKLFGDMAVVNFEDRRSIRDEFLIALGVQSHIDVGQIFENFSIMNWDHRQLIKYLTRFREQLSSEEIAKLRGAKIFPAIGIKDKRFTLTELYCDDPMIRKLSLPILSWKENKPPSLSSDSTIFMISLGLNTVAPWRLLLQTVATSSLDERTIIFRYFIDHYQSDYCASFSPQTIDFDYLPLKNVTDRLGKSNNCFTDDGVALLGFQVIHSELKHYAAIFNAKTRPSSDLIVERISRRSFSVENASILFSYLSTINDDFTAQQFKTLANIEFIPLNGSFYRPIDLFFSKGQFDIDDIFNTVDFEHSARPFLRSCGIQDEPKASHLIARLSMRAEAILTKMGVEKYLDLLRWISIQFDQLPVNTLNQLRNNCILLGLDYATSDDENEVLSGKYVLATAEDLFIIDDTVAQQLFHCLSVPMDSILEDFYRKLGSKPLSYCVNSVWKFGGSLSETEVSKALSMLIRTRAPLLTAVPSISKHRANNLVQLEGIEVFTVKQIIINREFRGRQRDQPTTACFQSETLLLITEGYEYFDVASLLCRVIYVESRLPDNLLIATLLSSSLASLRTKGFPVDRLLTKTSEQGGIKSIKHDDKSMMKPKEKNSERDNSSSSLTNPSFELTAESGKSSGAGRFLEAIKGAIKTVSASKSKLKTQSIDNILPSKIDEEGLERSLRDGVKALRSNTDTIIRNQNRVEPPPTIKTESHSYCEVIPSHHLKLWKSIDSVSIYVSVFVDSNFALEIEALKGFANLLTTIGGRIFDIPNVSMSIFVDPTSTAIAFNRNNSLFFNFVHYQRQINGNIDYRQLMASWFMTFCHELAHNFIGPHDERHEFYMSSYAEIYFSELVSVINH